ncbi:gluconokinase [Paracoccaceae bacterium GXU_MW_L88]
MENPRNLLVMGVCGSGKSTAARAIAEALNARFLEADDFHPQKNVAAMSRGEPLNDEMRWPWLAAVAEAAARSDGPVVIACSALKRSYRDLLCARVEGLHIVYLHAERDALRARMLARENHYMPESLLDSQLADLTPPEADEPHIKVDATLPVAQIVSKTLTPWADDAQPQKTGEDS